MKKPTQSTLAQRVAARTARGKTKNAGDAATTEGSDVPGITENPATNLLMADVAMRAGSYLLRNVVERNLLKGRYGSTAASDIGRNRSLTQTVASVAAAKFATRSVPGAVVIGGGVLVKALFDRSMKRRAAKRAGDAALLKQADESADTSPNEG